MAELETEIDQSSLPRVQEVCQSFAVLEDGALAHNLQEQEIEQYYTTNIQKNQLVQNDIRVAKRMQDEEEEQREQQGNVLRQATRQTEERDFEYARVIQEELQRCAEEAHRREQDDAEMAKRLQEEEEQWVKRRSRGPEGHNEGSTSEPLLQSPHQHRPGALHHRGEDYPSSTTRRQSFTSNGGAQFSEPEPEPGTGSCRRGAAHKSTTSWSNQGHVDPISKMSGEVRESLSDESEDSDAVFTEQLSLWSQRLYNGLNTAPSPYRASVHQPNGKNDRNGSKNELKRCEEEEEVGDCDEDHFENEDGQKRIPRHQDQERNHRKVPEDRHRSREQDKDCPSIALGERRHNRTESLRLNDRSRCRNGDLARTWSCKESPDKRVHFKDDNRSGRQQGGSTRVWEMLGLVLRERGVPVRVGGAGAPLQIRPQSRDNQVLHGREGSCGSSPPHQRGFQRAASSRHSFHGDIRARRRLSHRENSGRDHREDPDRLYDNGEVYKLNSGDSNSSFGERRGSARWREHKHINNDKNGERIVNDYRVRRTTSERRNWHKITEERLSSEEEEEEEERRVAHPRRRALQHSQSLSSSSSRASTRHRSSRVAGGASLEPEASLDLGELHQVLRDEELARSLQEEEEKLSRRKSQPSPRGLYPIGDFRVAQVAQDEEIARFMQKQEIKSKRRSRELEGPASWQEHRVISHQDRRAARERQVQRERLDSEGLPSPTEDCPPEIQPPSPVSTTPKAMQIRNIAEELDPTFQARRRSTDGLRVGPADPACGSPPLPHSGLHNFLDEPTFIPPTKRQTDKSGHTKPKEKKENCKQQ
ncbi:coiled-coil domain-containing protein 187 isoform X1 [Cololabis saira]|uniref:coiled-coil domain-containing protein 187 isoform X1 n=1 Tax=Cololabis saira TaxID=129043 RepID=UPI002AD5135C|nr:coiled-coil domain-containing protein 187 isoform X1 [Cololabis saira]XP_061591490.1 coiled-coil domain-containing protein 187 isoform X1 [Cololabis saira]